MLRFDVNKIIVIIIAIVAVHTVAPDWCDWLMEGKIGGWLQAIYDFLDEYTGPRLIIAGLIAFTGLWWARRIYRDKDYRWYRPFILLLGFVILYDQNRLDFLTIIGDFSYRSLCLGLGIVIIIAMAFKIVDGKFHILEKTKAGIVEIKTRLKRKSSKEEEKEITKEHPKEKKPLGFSDDNIQPGATPASLKQYAWTISDLLLGTNIDEHSFAIGVTGEWGSGKTTFLELLASVMEGRAELVRFNPWMCRTPEQVTDDFFASLQQQLSGRHSSLAKPIRDYARYISNATLSWGNGFLSKLTLAFPQDSLQEKKRRLSERFARLAEPVVVLIDDLDRLDRDEVFEVLRLIRNTADLRNVIYVVAYDKEYVTSVLSEKNIKDASAYLEKIFPVEIHQPKVEDFLIWQVLYNELLRINISESNFARQLFGLIGQNERQLIIKILGNYRQTKRFVRTYLLNVTYVQKAFRNEIKFLDLFWMELLQMYDKAVYDSLSKNPEKFLYRSDNRYILRPHIAKDIYVSKEEEKKAYEGERFWKEETPKLLEELFGKLVRPKATSICYAENFDKFFALGVSPYKVSLFDLKCLLTKKGEEETIIRQWIDNGKYYASISYQLDSVQTGRLNDDQFESYIKGILYFAMVVGEKGLDYGRVAKSMIEKKNFNYAWHAKGRSVALKWYEDRIAEHKDLVIITRMLKRAYVPVEIDENQKQIPGAPLLISNSDVKDLLKKAMDAYLIIHPEVNALSIFDEKSEMGAIFSNCSVLDVEGHPYEEFDFWENVSYEVLHKYLSKQPKQPFEQYRKAHQAMFIEENMPTWSKDPAIQDYYERLEEDRGFRMSAYFGTANSPFEKYLEAFFTKETQVKVEEKKTEKETGETRKKSKSKQLEKGTYNRKKK